MTVGALREILTRDYGWAMTVDWNQQASCARAWYVSEEKLEPRLGERFDEPIAAYEQPLAPGRDAAALFEALKDWSSDTRVAEFLLANPVHRHSLRRAQPGKTPYPAQPWRSKGTKKILDFAYAKIDFLKEKSTFFPKS